jgi:hypothetical protein
MERMRRLASPLFPSLALVLAVNDGVLKQRWPGVVTGKLSDFAGLALVAAIVAVVTGRARHSAVLTGLAFAALKLSPTVAVLSAPFLGGVTRTDATDLVALFGLVPLVVWFERHESRSGSWPAVLALPLVLLATIFTTTATSCDDRTGVIDVTVKDGIVRASTRFGSTLSILATSTNGGATWIPEATESTTLPESAASGPDTGPEQCLASGRCARVVDHQRVEERTGNGSWMTTFSYSDEDVARMSLRDPGGCRGSLRNELFSSIVALRTADGEHLVVAMGSTGVLHRRDGEPWQRLAVGPVSEPNQFRPLSTFGPRWLARLILLSIGLILISPVTLLMRTFRGRKRLWWIGLSAAIVFGAGLLIANVVVSFSTIDYVVLGTANIGLCVVALAVSLWLARIPAKEPRALPPPVRFDLPPPPSMPPPAL